MSNVSIAYNNKIDNGTTTITASHEDSGGLAYNLHHEQPTKQWISSVGTQVYTPNLQIDFGASVSFDIVALLDTNIQSSVNNTWRIRSFSSAANMAAGTSATYDSTAVRFSNDSPDYAFSHGAMVDSGFVATQYMRIDFTAIDLLSGDSVSAGRLMVGDLFQPQINMSYGAAIKYNDEAKASRASGGALYTVATYRYRTLEFELEHQVEADMFDSALIIDRDEGKTGDLFICQDLDRTDGITAVSIHGKQTETHEVINTHYQRYKKRYQFEEML